MRMTVNTNVGPQYQLTFGYDAKSRRIQKVVATNGVAVTTNKFLYDGWNLVAELGSSGTLVRGYTWGTDLSGSLQGAGGVGGLLGVSYYGTGTTNCFAAYDGNGNVVALVNGADGTLAASYEYGPFGEVIRQTGPMAKVNPFRFSSKYQDEESDLLYYGYRYYKASTGTWVSRDPAGSRRDLNLYALTKNHPVNAIDYLGLTSLSACQKLAMALNNGKPTGDSKIDAVASQINSNPTCNIHVTCASGCLGGTCTPTRKSDQDVVSEIKICVDKTAEGEINGIVLHEITHALQQCQNKDCDSGCDACMACETEAYKAQFPDLTSEQLQERAKASCSYKEPGTDTKPLCGGQSAGSGPGSKAGGCSSCAAAKN